MNRHDFLVALGALATTTLFLPHSANAAAPPQPAANSGTITVYVKDMHCAGCAKKISAKLYTVKGVASVRTDLQKHVATIQPSKQQEPSLKQIWEAVEAVEFEPVKMVANQQVHTKKPLK